MGAVRINIVVSYLHACICTSAARIMLATTCLERSGDLCSSTIMEEEGISSDLGFVHQTIHVSAQLLGFSDSTLRFFISVLIGKKSVLLEQKMGVTTTNNVSTYRTGGPGGRGRPGAVTMYRYRSSRCSGVGFLKQGD